MKKKIIRKLHLFFWGMILIWGDLHYTIGSFSIDLLNDLLGAIWIFQGVIFLKNMAIPNEAYTRAIEAARLGAILLLILSLQTFFTFEKPTWLEFGETICQLFIVFSLLRFCRGMQIFSEQNLLKESLARWTTLEKLFFSIYFVPLCLIGVINLIYIITINEGEPYILNLEGVGTIIVFIILFATILYPIIYGLITVKKMDEEIDLSI
jgi:hypothetical protein